MENLSLGSRRWSAVAPVLVLGGREGFWHGVWGLMDGQVLVRGIAEGHSGSGVLGICGLVGGAW